MRAPLGLLPFCPRCGADLLAPHGPRVVTHRYRLDVLLAAFATGLVFGIGLARLGP